MQKINNMLSEYAAAFLIGGTGYVLLELLWRGRSHISMFFTGGAAFLLLHALFIRYSIPLPIKCLCGMILITALLSFLSRGANQIASDFNFNKYASNILIGILLFFIRGWLDTLLGVR